MIPYARQSVDEADIAAVVGVLRSDFLTQGATVPRFEDAVAARVGARYAIATSNATAALHVALLALGIGPGDSVWTSPNSFVASANCALYCGAKVDFVDIDERSYNMSVPLLEQKLAAAERASELPSVVIPVHFAGQPCDMAGVGALARRYGFRVVEDASHAIGADLGGSPVGCGAFSDVTIFSFHAVKIITSAEGGMAVTNDEQLAERMRLFRSHGITRRPPSMQGAYDGPWSYAQIELGFNYRMTELQAALGESQLRRLDAFVSRRRAIAARYDRNLAGTNIGLPWQHAGRASAFHLYPVCVADRASVFAALHAAGIAVNVHYIPIHTQPYYRRAGFRLGDFPHAEAYYARCLSLPMFVDLTDADVDFVCDVLRRATGGSPTPEYTASLKSSREPA